MNAALIGERKFPLEMGRRDRGNVVGAVTPSGNEDELTAVVICATGAICASRTGDRMVLAMTEDAVDLSRFTGCPLLKDHRVDVDAVIGSVREAWLTGGVLYARVQFASAARHIAQMVEEGHLPRASIAFEVLEAQRHGETHTIATKWRPFELSLVALPEDPYARALSRDEQRVALGELADDRAAARVRAFHRGHKELRGPEWEAWASAIAPEFAADLGIADIPRVAECLKRHVADHLTSQLAGLMREAVDK